MKNSLLVRIVSALAALFIIILSYHFYQTMGWKVATDLIVLVGMYELLGILFPKISTLAPKLLCFVFTAVIFHLSAAYPSLALNGIAVLVPLFLVISLLMQNTFADLQDLTAFQAKSILSFVYMGLLPSFAYRLLDLSSGAYWFLMLLGVVFGGDIGAYALGLAFGKHKISPRLSPKKTWEGAVGGLLGSVITGAVCSYILPHVPIATLLVTSLCAGFVAQFGDFFESLLKRVADVKDSGKVMPGHGGVLDRIDGVLFASPVVFLVASLFEATF